MKIKFVINHEINVRLKLIIKLILIFLRNSRFSDSKEVYIFNWGDRFFLKNRMIMYRKCVISEEGNTDTVKRFFIEIRVATDLIF